MRTVGQVYAVYDVIQTMAAFVRATSFIGYKKRKNQWGQIKRRRYGDIKKRPRHVPRGVAVLGISLITKVLYDLGRNVLEQRAHCNALVNAENDLGKQGSNGNS